jgi:hypothetical protein
LVGFAELGDVAVQREAVMVMYSIACSLMTSRTPGMPMQTGQTCVFGAARIGRAAGASLALRDRLTMDLGTVTVSNS